jgi:hypothetical protein
LIGSQSIEPLISMDKNFVRADILILMYESSLDKKVNMASIGLHMLVIDDIFFSYIYTNLDRLLNR